MTATTTKAAQSSPADVKSTKLDILINLLGGAKGASMAEMIATTGWQAHSIRGAIAGAVKRKGHGVISFKEGAERRWRLAKAAAK